MRGYNLPVIIECTNCTSKYQYDEGRFEGKASKKIKCSKCGTIFEIFNPSLARKREREKRERYRGRRR
jgi:hypothetical protein